MIRWITDFLGTSAWNDINHEDASLCVIDVRDLVDKRGNYPEEIRKKIDLAVKFIKQGNRVVICCDYGVSRSNAIAAGVLSLVENLPFSDAIHRVIQSTGEKKIKIQMLSTVRNAVNEEEIPFLKTNTKKTILIVGTGVFGIFLKKQLSYHLENTVVISQSEKKLDLLHSTNKLDQVVQVNNVGHLIHLAEPEIFSDSEAMGTSITLLKNSIDVCCDNGITLVYPSNSEIYSGYQSAHLRALERLQPNPKSIHGQTKALCEKLIEYSEHNDGLRYLILRYGTIYGNNKPRFLYNFINLALHDKDITTHRYQNGFPIVDLLHINDAVAACVAALKNDRFGIFNIGSGNGLTTFEIAQKIIEQSDSKSKIGHINIDGDAPNIVLDISYAKKILDWKPVVDFNNGLKSIITRYTEENS